jgi:hypothetical protein
VHAVVVSLTTQIGVHSFPQYATDKESTVQERPYFSVLLEDYREKRPAVRGVGGEDTMQFVLSL